MRPLRALIVDDSPTNRRVLRRLLEQVPGVQVVGQAADGDEALRMALELSPDFITLDLEMPRMDGFTFLRLLMARRPTPVFVVSSHSAKDKVFRAMELGAIDFVAKPQESLANEPERLQEQLREVVLLVQQLSPTGIDARQRRVGSAAVRSVSSPDLPKREVLRTLERPPRHLVVVAASTGGPTALLELFARLPAAASAAVVVAQHMPERFTRTFAERLDRHSTFRVTEGKDGQLLSAGTGVICPGGRSLAIVHRGPWMATQVAPPHVDDRYAPSADRLFASAAGVAGGRVIAVVLTGMGDDGAQGVVAVKDRGGRVFAEGPETAVVYGMPRAAELTGRVDEKLPLGPLVERLVELIT